MPPKKDIIKGFKFDKVSGLTHKFGAHIGTSGGVSKGVLNARNIGANSFALFLKSPRKWQSPPIPDTEAAEFKRLCQEHGYNPKTDILPHGLYFINLANTDQEKEAQAYAGFIDDLRRCEQLGIGLYNFHPGSSLDNDHADAIKNLAKNINRAIAETEFVKIVIENMAGTGNLIGSNLQDIKDVIDLIDNKERVGVCIDTCHTFAAGYDIRTEKDFNKFMDDFDEIIGAKYLSAIHLNDSKAPLAANRDLHQRLGLGFLGLEIFRVIANSKRLEGIPIVLETPAGKEDSIWGEEIKLLEFMQGKSETDASILAKAEELSKLGASERKVEMGKYEKKQCKAKKETKRSANTIDMMVKKQKKTSS